MMFALVSMIYPRITLIGKYSDIREHLQTFNVDYLGTSKMDISCLCSEHSTSSGKIGLEYSVDVAKVMGWVEPKFNVWHG